jgi:hypothetical protein
VSGEAAGGVFEEARRELEGVCRRLADRPRMAVVRLLLMALEREEIVSMAYRQAQIADRLRRMPIPDDFRRLVERAVVWLWKDEEMHAVYARGALMRLGGVRLRLQALAQQMGGIVAGWATSVLHHATWRSAPLSRLAAGAITGAGRLAGKVPKEVNRQLRFLPFREFCLLNAELEKASWLSWDSLALLAERQGMVPEMLTDFHRVAEDEIRHKRVFEAIAACLTPDDGLVQRASARALADRIAEVSPHYLPHDLRPPCDNPIGSGGRVWCVAGAPGEDGRAALRRTLHEAGLADALRRRAAALGKAVGDLRVIVKACFMLGYDRRDPSPQTDPALIREMVDFFRGQGVVADVAVAESRNLYDHFFAGRSVREVAAYFGLNPEEGGFLRNGTEAVPYRLVDLSEEQRPHEYRRGMGQTTVAASWRDADFRVTFGKVRSHPTESALLALSNTEAVGGRTDQFLFAERQADRSTALMMILDDFPPHFAVLDCFADVPDGVVGMMGCPRPRQPRRFYAGADVLAVDCVAGRHLGWRSPDESPLVAAAGHWFGGWPEGVTVVGCDEPVAGWRGPYDNEWRSLLALLAMPTYVWGSGRGSLFVPEMDPEAFPAAKDTGRVCRGLRCTIRALLGLRPPAAGRPRRSGFPA